MSDSISQKRCSACETYFPATTDYFHRNKAQRDGWNNECKACKNKRSRAYDQRPEVREKRLPRQKAWNDAHKDYHRDYYQVYNEVNKEAIKEQKRTYHQRTREHHHAVGKLYYQKHRDAVLARHKRNHLAHVDEYRARYKRYYRENIEWIQAHHRAYAQTERGKRASQVAQTRYKLSEKGQISRQQYYRQNKARILVRALARNRTERGKILLAQKAKRYNQTERGKALNRIRTKNRYALKKNVSGVFTPEDIKAQFQRQKGRCYYAACGHARFEKRNGKYVYHIEHTFPLSRVSGTDIPANSSSYLVLACPSCNGRKNNKFPHEWPEGGRLL